jgi:hypothetical protein
MYGRDQEREAIAEQHKVELAPFEKDSSRLGSSLGRMQLHARVGDDKTVSDLIDRVLEPPRGGFERIKQEGVLYLHPDFNAWNVDYIGRPSMTLGVYVYPVQYKAIFITDNSSGMPQIVDEDQLRIRAPWIGDAILWGPENEPNRFKK